MGVKTAVNNGENYTLVTGGAGFVGVNLADRLLMKGKKVLVFDNLSRAGVEKNLLAWLKEKYSDNLQYKYRRYQRPCCCYAVEKRQTRYFILLHR